LGLRIWTIGHSTRSLDQFLQLLAWQQLEAVVDVRRYPGSRRWPQFTRDALTDALADRGLLYLWCPELGGRRRPVPRSPNTAWRSAAFRGYADHMMTEEFAGGLGRLVNVGCGVRTAIMCAEAVWWRCHRGLIADALRWLGFEVSHILGPASITTHPYTSAARVVRGQLTYALPGAA
jgi:uncharacterized protein (DUF488 family)